MQAVYSMKCYGCNRRKKVEYGYYGRTAILLIDADEKETLRAAAQKLCTIARLIEGFNERQNEELKKEIDVATGTLDTLSSGLVRVGDLPKKELKYI